MQNRWIRGGVGLAMAVCCLWALAPGAAEAAREAKTKATGVSPEGDLEAKRLYDKAQELLQMQESERAVAMLESIIEQYPGSSVTLSADLTLGKYYLGAHEQTKAINYLTRLKNLDQGDRELSSGERDVYLEAMYLMGVAYFQMRQYGAAFPILRKITNNYPNTVWANQAYYYIGMCHFAQQNWNKAIDALSLVGTFVDPNSPTVQYVEAGRRFYLKIQDADLPVLVSQGKKVVASLETTHGDKESMECIPLTAEGDVFIGSLPTEIGLPKVGDQVLQVLGGDMVTVHYVDENTQEGATNTVREGKVRVVSTAALNFTLGDYETRSSAQFLDQPLFVLLADADLDKTDQSDTTQIKLISRYVQEEGDEAAAAKTGRGTKPSADGEKKYLIRDTVVLTLNELGAAPVHTGRFGGSVMVQTVKAGETVNQSDQILTCDVDDEIIATYTDELNINGEQPRPVEARIPVLGEIDNRPKASQDVVSDTVVKCKKNIVEATAYLELARIFKSMGLNKGAKEKTVEGLDRVDYVIRTGTPIPAQLKQDAFRLKWELHIAADDFASAIATCNLFNRLFPDSPFVDQALMGIGKIRMENKEYNEAIGVYQQVLGLPKSEAKAEAQFGIAQATEAMHPAGSEAAIQQYKLCAERYPESQFAGTALAKLVDYHVDTKDYAQATAMLEQIFQDYPDAPFLDSMLLKWVLVAYRSGDYQKAAEKCSQLVFEYPESPYAEKAKQIMPKIESRLKKGSDKPAEKSGE